MCLSASQIIYSFIMMPSTLPPSYIRFLNKQAAKEPWVWKAVQVGRCLPGCGRWYRCETPHLGVRCGTCGVLFDNDNVNYSSFRASYNPLPCASSSPVPPVYSQEQALRNWNGIPPGRLQLLRGTPHAALEGRTPCGFWHPGQSCGEHAVREGLPPPRHAHLVICNTPGKGSSAPAGKGQGITSALM